ncbi:MAG TPA: cytochrome b/b6 domain-containing protein [Candidatus Dormibacteraeota bacterium]|nr:cytochrome b/b6 domain-containing protein [Candidatus Dormibacteraeota bacterium]
MTSTRTSSSPPAGDPQAERFDATERLFHWTFAIPFLVTMATGLGLYFPNLAKLAGNREVVRDLHRFAGLATVLLPALVVAFGDRRRLRQDLEAVDLWSSDDRKWFRSWLWRKVGGRDRLPPQGRFNAGQKFNAVLTAASLLWLAVTGLIIFPGIHPPFWLVSNSRDLHNLAWIVLTPAVIGHVYLAAVYPPTRPGLSGIITGRVPLAWLRQHHPLAPEAKSPGPNP